MNPAAPSGGVTELRHELTEGHPGPPLGGRGLGLDVLHVGGEHTDLRGDGDGDAIDLVI